jgi:hypothetical protein
MAAGSVVPFIGEKQREVISLLAALGEGKGKGLLAERNTRQAVGPCNTSSKGKGGKHELL